MNPTARRWLLITWRALLALTAVVVTVLLAGDQNDMFDVSRKLLFGGALTLALATALDGVVGTVTRVREVGRDAAEARVQKNLVGLLVGINRSKNVDIAYLGASVYVPALRWVLSECRWHPTSVLVRVMRFRIESGTPPSKVARVKGKAAVGECWQTARTIHRDWRDQLVNHSRPDLTAAEFAALPPVTKDGYTHGEFVGIAHKYSEVLAAPILSVGGAVVGVISIDVSASAGRTDLILEGPETEGAAEQAAEFIEPDLKSLYPVE